MSQKRPDDDRKKDHIPWKDLPSFCDASGSVSVAIFASRRLPETKEIWSQTVNNKHPVPVISTRALQSGGKKTSSRHLRRRATSHQSYKRHRFPTTGRATTNQPTVQGTSRRARRRRQQSNTSYSWTEPGTEVSAKCFLATHVWHAKRFHMLDVCGWKVPLLHTNRGAHAALRLSQERCLVQDATWCQQPIWVPLTSDLPLQQVIPNFSHPAVVPLFQQVCAGEGMVHQRGAFPRGAIAPVSWLICPKPLWSADGAPVVCILAHPAVHDVILQQVRSLCSDCPSCDGPFLYVQGGLSCLKVRGKEAEACLRKSILSSANEMETYLESQPTHDNVLSLPDLHFVRHAPRDPSLTSNRGVTGFDIYCPAAKAKTLFHAMILQGGACPIGLVEDSHLRLEAEPPLAVFPRDFPDTPHGALYWSTGSGGGGSSSSSRSSSNEMWTTVRRYFEGGMGRIRVTGAPLCEVDWSALAVRALGDEESQGSPVVVRGDFGKPFDDALFATSSYVPKAPGRGQKRRRAHPAATVKAPGMAADGVETFRASCNALLQNLSLPALLFCHIHVPGKGVLEPGDDLLSTNVPYLVLGRVCTGTFSPSRGISHGTGLLGGARFLQDILAGKKSSYLVRKADGSREVQWGVIVRRQQKDWLATIAFVF